MGLMAHQTIDIAEEKVSVLDSIIELSKMKQTGEKSISELWETFKWLNMCVIFILKGNGTRKEAKKLKSNGHNFFLI